ncbi:MAG: type IV pilin protein [Gallionella sp.]
MKAEKGFTLIELMIVVVVIAILSAVGYPAYTDYVTRSKLTEATAALSNGRIKMEQFFQDNRTYDPGVCPADTNNFDFICDNLSATTYQITAEGATVSLIGYDYHIDQANVKSSETPWGNSVSCWVINTGGAC